MTIRPTEDTILQMCYYLKGGCETGSKNYSYPSSEYHLIISLSLFCAYDISIYYFEFYFSKHLLLLSIL